MISFINTEIERFNEVMMGATFFTQITMLNMLIAIMGDAFDREMDNFNVNKIKL